MLINITHIENEAGVSSVSFSVLGVEGSMCLEQVSHRWVVVSVSDPAQAKFRELGLSVLTKHLLTKAWEDYLDAFRKTRWELLQEEEPPNPTPSPEGPHEPCRYTLWTPDNPTPENPGCCVHCDETHYPKPVTRWEMLNDD